nr:SGNH hydrolase-type esterase domain-containing protein [Tanacetum cinerariifolium]
MEHIWQEVEHGDEDSLSPELQFGIVAVLAKPQLPCYFIFGDSLVDSGNNNELGTKAKANYLPYGIDFPQGATGRFTNGRTMADIIDIAHAAPFLVNGVQYENGKSKEDQTRNISKSIFITNFPDNISSRDLWNECEKYGKVIDVYIPNRKSKAGKRYAFVRFIKVEDLDRLVSNLCTIWIGRLHIHANVV